MSQCPTCGKQKHFKHVMPYVPESPNVEEPPTMTPPTHAKLKLDRTVFTVSGNIKTLKKGTTLSYNYNDQPEDINQVRVYDNEGTYQFFTSDVNIYS